MRLRVPVDIEQFFLGRCVGRHLLQNDPKAGAAESLYRLADDPRLNHRMRVEGGLLGEQAADLLKAFFRRKRLERSLT